MRVAHVEDAYAAGEVDERVSVDVGEERAVRLVRDDGKVDGQRVGDGPRLPLEDLLRAGPGIAVRSSIERVVATAGAYPSHLPVPGAHAVRLGWRRALADVEPDPLTTVAAWYAEAEAAGVAQPDAAALATAAPDGRPSARMVLLKVADARSLVFFTNLSSRKGDELAANPRAALVLYWHGLGRQIRVEGRVEQLSRAEVERLLADPPAWKPHRRLGLRPVSPGRKPGSARGALDRRRRAIPGRGRAATGLLGRLPGRTRRGRALGTPREPPARPCALRAHRRRLAGHTADAVVGATLRVARAGQSPAPTPVRGP